MTAVGVGGVGAPLYAQIASLKEVSGAWEGNLKSGDKVSVDLDASGKFEVEMPRGTDGGVAKLERGELILPFTRLPGQIRVTKKGDGLEGALVLGINAQLLTLKRRK